MLPIQAFVVVLPLSRAVVRRRQRTPVCVVPTPPGERPLSERESEIAGKIESLRRQKRREARDELQKAKEEGTTGEAVFEDAKHFYASDIAAGEAFFGTAPKSEAKQNAAAYKPKVSTWGMFQRPDNISRAYGGGRSIPVGGTGKVSEAQRERDARVAAKLAKYRGASAAETEREAENVDIVDAALKAAEKLCTRGRAFEATRVLRDVLPLVGKRTARGGEVRLALALACEDCGRRTEARELYGELARNVSTDIRRKAKRLAAGFADMAKLGLQDGASDGQLGFRSSDFQLPEFSVRRYDILQRESEPLTLEEQAEASRNNALALLVLAILIGAPLLALVVLRSQMSL